MTDGTIQDEVFTGGIATYVGGPFWANHDAALYQCSPPMPDEDGDTYGYVVVSAIQEHCVETYIFGATADGTCGCDALPGSEQGVYSHERALANAGYRLVRTVGTSAQIETMSS